MKWIIGDDYMTCSTCKRKFFKVIPIPNHCPCCLSDCENMDDYEEYIMVDNKLAKVIELNPIEQTIKFM